MGVTSAVLGAGALGSKGGGGGAKTPKATKWQQDYANQLFTDTDPIRQQMFARSSDFLASGDPRDTPTYEALKLATDSNFNQAKDNLLGRFGRGGGLVSAMSDLEGQRALGLSQGAGSIYNQELDRALMLGTGMANTSLSGLGQAGNVQAQIAQANAAANAQQKGALGQAAGIAAGSYLGNK